MQPASSPIDHALQTLVTLSRRYGSDPAFVLAGGGNTSFKQGDRLWVKASGHALANIDVAGFVELDRPKLEAMLHADWPADPTRREAAFMEALMAARVNPQRNQRPSVEALLHHLLPTPYVVHTHPGRVNALTCCTGGPALARELFGDEVLWQPYVDPGLVLAGALREAFLAHRSGKGKAPAAILLANHGLIVAGESPQEIDRHTAAVLKPIDARLREAEGGFGGPAYKPRPQLLEVYAEAVRRLHPELHVVTDASDPVLRLVGTQGGRDAALSGPLTPDQIVYCRSLPLWIETRCNILQQFATQWESAWRGYMAAHGCEFWVALIAGVGLLAVRPTPAMARTAQSLFADAAQIYFDAARLGGIRPLGQRERRFIEAWEVEAYRRKVAASARTDA